MTVMQKISTAVLALLLALAGAAWWKTAPPSAKITKKTLVARAAAEMVDQGTYATALRLAQLPAAPEEQTFIQSALRIADHELDLSFTAALREFEAHPPALSAEAAKIQDRIQKSQTLLDADQQRVAELTAALSKAKPAKKDAVKDELGLAQSQLELDKDELEEAGQDLIDSGGNLQQQIETMMQEHAAQVKARTIAQAAGMTAAPQPHGSLTRVREWLRLRHKTQELEGAQAIAARKEGELAAKRAALAATRDSAKSGISALRQQHTHEDAAALVSQAKLIAADQKVLTLLDRRGADLRQLATLYGQWANMVTLQSHVVAHALLFNVMIVILVLLVLVFLDEWLQHLLDNPKLDRRQVETLRSLTRAGLRVLGVLIILLIVVGIPSQFGTMIGIVGAGLTVALKDFIVAFFGWLMLMGRNGIRIGDWVEINGVSGEVTELGMFHTVLLETGNWSDSGHPTGRRVTFTNSFAIEGHYFNFSTSGQWLWDELQVVVPAGQDPYPIVEAITKKVAEATAEGAKQAEEEWQQAVPAQRAKVFSGTPGINVKPVVGGVEISIRYITRANDRFLLRAKLYQAAVDLLGGKSVAPAAELVAPKAV